MISRSDREGDGQGMKGVGDEVRRYRELWTAGGRDRGGERRILPTQRDFTGTFSVYIRYITVLDLESRAKSSMSRIRTARS